MRIQKKRNGKKRIVQRSEQLIIIPRQIVCEKLFLIQLKYYYYTCTQLSQMVQ